MEEARNWKSLIRIWEVLLEELREDEPAYPDGDHGNDPNNIRNGPHEHITLVAYSKL